MLEAECRDRTELNFHRFLRTLKGCAPELYELAVRKLTHKNYHLMLHELRFQRPELYEEILKLLQAMEKGETSFTNSPPKDVKIRAKEIADTLTKQYKCDSGFQNRDVIQRETATVYLKGPQKILGLPPNIISLSDSLAIDFGGHRKWTFSFDNRIFTVDLTKDAIEQLRKNSYVEKVEIEPIAHILSNEIPKYDPNAVNTDWGVSRLNPEYAWNKALYGQDIKVCVIDTGIQKSHPAFLDSEGKTIYKGGYNFVGNTDNPEDDHDHGCLSPDGLIYTSLGIESIKSFWERFATGEELEIDLTSKNIETVALDTNNPNMSYARINKVFKIAVDESITVVKSRSGMELKLTPWHPTFVFDGKKIIEKRADALIPGDILLRPAAKTLLSQGKEKVDGVLVDEDLAYALGLFLGDGFFRPAYQASIGLSNTDSKIGQKFLDVFKPLATSVGTAKDKRTGVDSYLVYGKCLYKLVRKLTGVLEEVAKTYHIAIPQIISRSPASVISAFLAGYLDTDGHVSGRVNTAIWSTVSKTMADQLAFLLSLLGVKAQIVICKSKRANEVTCYQVTVTGIEGLRKLHYMLSPYLTSDIRRKRLTKIAKKTTPWNVKNTGVPLAPEIIDQLRTEAQKYGVEKDLLKGSKDRRTAKGPAKYRLKKLLDKLEGSETAQYLRNLIENFHFDLITEIERRYFKGYFYDLNVEGCHNYLAGNFGATFIHNTYCCSIIAGQHNGVLGSYRGIAPNVELYACKVLDAKGSGSMANVAAGIDWARINGMDVLSLSLGAASGSSTLEDVCTAAWYAGCLLVAAAGNSGPDPDTVLYPGYYPSTIAVAAVDYGEVVASFSSRGPQVEVSAPGRYITGAWAGFTYDDYQVEGSGGQYMCASGTSAACPHVAGGACLAKSWYPLATNIQLRQWLIDNVRDI